MDNIGKQLIQLGIIDAPLVKFKVEDWFKSMTISFIGIKGTEVVCKFEQCFKLSLDHCKSYSKNIRENNTMDCKYFTQNIEITKVEELYHVKISAWPLDAIIECKDIILSFEND